MAEENKATPIQRRRYYRLRYPEGEGPFISIDRNQYRVFEISEGGARVFVPDTSIFSVGDEFEGFILFNDSEKEYSGSSRETVKARVLRIHEGVIVLKFHTDEGVSLQRMMHEQITVRKNHPHLF